MRFLEVAYMNADIKIIDTDKIIEAVAELCIESNIHLCEDIHKALLVSQELETSPQAKTALDLILKNADAAKKEQLPICQDTGMAVVFVKIGSNIHINGDINDAINEGVRQGYRQGYLRNSIVNDPIKRINTKDNTPAVIYYEFIPGDELIITVAPKGFGSENMSGIRMLTPSDGIEGVNKFVLETVQKAGSNPCPPIIVGVGIGGTMEKAALLSKQALLRKVGSVNTDSFWAKIESDLLTKINELNIGAAGFGGKTTALGVHILTYPTHIAGLPVAVNIGCHVTRHKTIVLSGQ